MIRKDYIVAENQRGLLIKDGRLVQLLDPGRHRLWDWGNRQRVELVSARGLFTGTYAEVIEKLHPEIAAASLGIVRPAEGQVAVVSLDGRASYVVRAGETVRVWKVLNEVRVAYYDVDAKS